MNYVKIFLSMLKNHDKVTTPSIPLSTAILKNALCRLSFLVVMLS